MSYSRFELILTNFHTVQHLGLDFKLDIFRFVVSYDLVTSPASSGAEGQNRGPPARLAQSRKLTPPPVFSICGTARVVAASTSTGIHLLDPATLAVTHVLANSRDGFSLAAGSDHLYSTHRDRTVKVWDLNERAYVESLFGHQDIPTAVDVLVMGGRGPNSSTSKRIVTSGGFDNTLRMWKIDEESQLVYNWADEDVIDVVKVTFICKTNSKEDYPTTVHTVPF